MSGVPFEMFWLVFGVVLLLAEFVVPGLVIAFFGVGALFTALTTWVGLTNGLTSQLIVFLLVSIASLVLLRRYIAQVFAGKTSGQPNQDFTTDIGKIVKVISEIKPGHTGGRVKWQGTPWNAESEQHILAGEEARIVNRNNLTLMVEKVPQEN